MKTHSGSFWIDVLDLVSVIGASWVIAFFLAFAWWNASRGDVRMFAFDAVFAIFVTVRLLSAWRRILDHVARIAIADHRIEDLRKENDRLAAIVGGAN